MSFGDTRKKVLEHLSLNSDGFWTTIPLQLRTATGETQLFSNAKTVSKHMKVTEREVVEAVVYNQPIHFHHVEIDAQFQYSMNNLVTNNNTVVIPDHE